MLRALVRKQTFAHMEEWKYKITYHFIFYLQYKQIDLVCINYQNSY